VVFKEYVFTYYRTLLKDEIHMNYTLTENYIFKRNNKRVPCVVP
jgi:hypothetical protein